MGSALDKRQRGVCVGEPTCSLAPGRDCFEALAAPCACRLAAAKARFAVVRRAGIAPDVRMFSMLMEAAKRAGRPDAAAAIFHVDMRAAGVAPDTRAWNALLGALGRNGQIDAAYAAWQARCQQACSVAVRASRGHGISRTSSAAR